MEKKDWIKHYSFQSMEGEEGLINAARKWFDDGNGKMKSEQYEKYSLMLQLGHEK